jgi:hypothetical protein
MGNDTALVPVAPSHRSPLARPLGTAWGSRLNLVAGDPRSGHARSYLSGNVARDNFRRIIPGRSGHPASERTCRTRPRQPHRRPCTAQQRRHFPRGICVRSPAPTSTPSCADAGAIVARRRPSPGRFGYVFLLISIFLQPCGPALPPIWHHTCDAGDVVSTVNVLEAPEVPAPFSAFTVNV